MEYVDEKMKQAMDYVNTHVLFIDLNKTKSDAEIEVLAQGLAAGAQFAGTQASGAETANVQVTGDSVTCLVPEPLNQAICAVQWAADKCASNDRCRSFVNKKLLPVHLLLALPHMLRV